MKRILEELNGNRNGHTPVWIMRQAGRYLPEYRKLRQKADFLRMCRTPDLACQVTLMPIKRFDLDAAIIFSDILIPLVPMGMELEFSEKIGPVFKNPISTEQDIAQLKIPDIAEECAYVAEAVNLVKSALKPDTALIGFAGAPFTLASYMVEGKSSKDFKKIKSLLSNQPDQYRALLDKVTGTVKRFLDTQINSGAEVIQLFDTWGGMLSPEDYKNHSHPFSAAVIDHVASKNIPVIHFVRNVSGFLEGLLQSRAACISIDWQIALDEADRRLEGKRVLQGNLDPGILLKDRDAIRAGVMDVLEKAKSLKGHIFNLGHGVLPETPVDNVGYLVDLVHKETGK
jgi:uroporphyrinogen decarboxylase